MKYGFRIEFPIHAVAIMRLLMVLCVVLSNVSLSRADYLYSSYVLPSFDGNANTEFSRWEIMYVPYDGINYPDDFAPNGTLQTATNAGFSVPAGSSPSDPLAFFHTSNPTLTQTATNTAFIISPGSTGNIYSFSAPTAFEVSDSTPYTAETVMFQFQTEGSPVDLDTVRLEYDNGGGTVSLAPDQYVREYSAGTSTFGGFSNRSAFQWNLSSLGVSEYKIVFESEDSSMSFQQALLDTAATYSSEVPELRTWTGTGSQNWGTTSNWQEGSINVTNGNIRFNNSAAVTISDSSNRTAGEILFDSPADVTINNTGTLTSNTGILSGASATGTYRINGNYELGAYGVMAIEAGEVRLNGVVSGAYGMLKVEAGTLVLANNNTFGGTGGVGVQGGFLRIEGTNTFTGSSAVTSGDLVIAANAPEASVGALGDATSAITVGASSTALPGTAAGRLIIDGDYTIGRKILINNSAFGKALGATGTTTQAVFSNEVDIFGTSSDLDLFAQNGSDRVEFQGLIKGGSSSKTVTINGNGETGTVVYSVSNKTYSSNTSIAGGELEVASGISTTGNGSWAVASGSTLRANGVIGGSGTLTLNGGKLAGSGTVNKVLLVDSADVIAPGNSIDTISFSGDQTWGIGGILEWEINDVDATAGSDPGWDRVAITGGLDISATLGTPFVIKIQSLDVSSGSAGAVHDFDGSQSYSWVIATTTTGITGFSADKFAVDTSGLSNSNSGTFGVDESGNNLVLTYTPSGSSGETFSSWSQSLPVGFQGAEQDADGDGVSNIIEFAFGRDGNASSADQPVIASIIEETTPGTFVFKGRMFLPEPARQELTYQVEVSETLAPDSWSVIATKVGTGVWTGPATVTEAVPSGGLRQITVEDIVATSAQSKRFMRVSISGY